MRKAISYIRMSSEQQLKGSSLKRQLELTKEYALKNNLDLKESIQDLGVSAFSGEHAKTGELGVFLNAIKNKEFPEEVVLLVESLDRLSRQKPTTAFKQLTDILEYGIEVHTTFDGQIYTQASIDSDPSQLFISIGSMIRAHEESKVKSDRLKKAWAYKRGNLDNKILTRLIPSWIEYNETSKEMVLVPGMAKVIRKIFQLSVEENSGSYVITRYLNANLKDFPKPIQAVSHNNRTTTWGESYVKKILSNTSVYGDFQPHKMVNGVRVPDGEPIKDYFPAVISKEEFLLCKKRIKDRKLSGAGRKGSQYSNIFSQLLVCSECGGRVVYLNKGKAPKGGSYLCCRRSNEGSCNSLSWAYDDFEAAFLSYLTELPLQDVFSSSDAKSKKRDIEKEQAQLMDRIREEQLQFDGLMKKLALLDDSLVPNVNAAMAQLQKSLKELQKEVQANELKLNDLTNRNPKKMQKGLVKGINDFKEKNSDEDIKQLRQKISAITRGLVDKVVINTLFPKVEPWEVDLLDSRFVQQFEDNKTNRTKYQTIEDFLLSDYGQRKLAHYQRYFIVHFKNGVIKMIQPSIDISLDTKSFKMIERFVKKQ